MTTHLPPPVLQALAWRLVDRDTVAIEQRPEDGRSSEQAWVHRRLINGPHGLPFQLADDAWHRAAELAPEPIQGLALIARQVLRLEQGVPRVADEEAWDSVCRIIDGELLALAHPDVRQHCNAAAQQRLCWPPVLRAQRSVFHGACDGALAEIHAHIGGSMPNCLLWGLLLHGALSIQALNRYRPDGQTGDRWANLILQAREAYRLLACRCESRSVPLAVGMAEGIRFDAPIAAVEWPLAGALIDRSATMALLVPDRVLLFEALRRYGPGNEWPRIVPGDEAAEERVKKRRGALLKVIGLRNAFNVLLSQPPSHRGLVEFLGHYDRRSGLWCTIPKGSARRRLANRTEVLGFELLLETWLDDRDADHDAPFDIEFRTALPLRNREPREFLLAFARALRRVLRRRRLKNVRVGLIHHTIKSSSRADGEAARLDFERLWFLLREVPAFRHLLVGVDAAANELACPPRTFSKAYVWLREQLDRTHIVDEPPLRLGFTFHAGEDFRDLLTGIRHVDEAAHLLGMLPGDRLGHALALFWPVDDFYIARQQAFPTVGDHALDLCWAAALLHRHDGYGDLERDAHERLMDLLTEIGAKPRVDVVAIIKALDIDAPHAWASPRAQTLQHARPATGPDTPRALMEVELLELLGIAPEMRRHMAPRPPRALTWQRLAGACQALVQGRVLDKGLVIEINPSSNRIVGGFASLARLPYTRVSKPGPRMPGQAANLPLAIGTDDAGIFHTTLRREYDIVGQAAFAQGFALPDVHAWLDDIRATARRASFLGPHRPSGIALLQVLDRLLGRRAGE